MFAHIGGAQADLFGEPLLPGLSQREDFLTSHEEKVLIARIEGTSLSPFRYQQWTGKRLTRSYGWSYDFETGRFAPTDPIPDWLQSIRARAARYAGLDAEEIVQALLIGYGEGDGIGWHRDRPVFGHVVGISLGEPAQMRFRRRKGGRFERVSAPLMPRGIYHLAGEARNEWEHSIAEMDAPRWSITFRSLQRAT